MGSLPHHQADMAMQDIRRDSDKIKDSLEQWGSKYFDGDAFISPTTTNAIRPSQDSYDEYLTAMRRVQQSTTCHDIDMLSPRQRHRKKDQDLFPTQESSVADMEQATRISTIASMVPDEIIYKHSDYSVSSYETALMFIDVSGFTELCETYKKTGRGGPSRLTQVLNSYIGAMVQEILTHNGDVLKFSGDAFLSMWKGTPTLTMQDVAHTAIDCGLIIQKNYGRHVTDVGVVLKVKVAISVGPAHFSLIGDNTMEHQHYVIIGQPVWDVKMAEYMSTAGDVITTASTWLYVNEQEYCTQPCGDGMHTKVLGVGVTWKRVEKIDYAARSETDIKGLPTSTKPRNMSTIFLDRPMDDDKGGIMELETREIREFSLRPAVISALRSSWWPALRAFMLTPVLRAVDNDEPMDFLTEVRHVVVVFINIITVTVTDHVLIGIVDTAYKLVCSITSESGGLVNKVSMFDKDMMFLVVFGLRGLKHEDEAQKALLCASHIKENLTDPNILSVSIGITSGTTYCGVVGHVLRREYTVIGSAVNKAARLMIAYKNKVTCDKETFVRSKLGLDFFRLMEIKPLKGIEKPGPVYEFNESGWVDRLVCWRHPILGRNEEMRRYKTVLKEAMNQHHERFTRYRDHKFAVAITGQASVGKKRLFEEFLNITPVPMQLERIVLTESDNESFELVRLIMRRVPRSSLVKNGLNTKQDTIENLIRFTIGMMSLTPLQIYAANTIFDCRFPLPERFYYSGDLLGDQSVRELLLNVFKKSFPSLRVLPVMRGNYIDDASWRVLLILLETKHVFVLLSLLDYKLSAQASVCLDNNMIVKMHLSGIDRWYHAALACQLLDVQAIPADLEKVIESASNGLPGWIQNFLISLIQRGELTVHTVPRCEAVEAGAVLPSSALLQRADYEIDNTAQKRHGSLQSFQGSILSPSVVRKQENLYTIADNDTIQMAVLKESYNFDDLKIDMTMDVIILKTYDSLTPFEKMLLKCGSVLGDVFSRRMLLHLLQSDSLQKVSLAVAKLFEIRVLECEGGDFTRDTSMVLVHPAPAAVANILPPYCSCLGTRQPPDCRDLPIYAFCGYMKFRHSLFRTTTYDLLTENQKREMHSRALMYLERYTRRCNSCGAGCFNKLFGVRCDDGLVAESKAVKRVRQQIAALSAETRMNSENTTFDDNFPEYMISQEEDYVTGMDYLDVDEMRRQSHPGRSTRKVKHVRSFSSLDLENCECMPILLAVYSQVIEHVKGVGECTKIFESYIEYADLSVINQNLPQAFRLLYEVEEFVKSDLPCNLEKCRIKWMKDFRLARILTSRAWCLLESGDYSEARKQLYTALKLYCDPFPTTKLSMKLRNMKCSFHQTMALYVAPRLYIATESGLVAMFYDLVSKCLCKLFTLFTVCNEWDNAELTAKWALNYALKSCRTFRVLCVAYSNMIAVYRQKQNFSKCVKLEKMAMDACNHKRGQLDVTEVFAVCALYTNIFLFYVEYGKKMESLEFGLSVIPMITSFSDLKICQTLVLWMLKLLLSDLRINEMIMIMREFFYMTDNYDLSSETWYYYYAVVIMLDTGFCVESYGACERFYSKKGDAIIRSKTPEAAWNFFVCMWLVTIRVGAWERTILWEEKIKEIMAMKLPKQEFNVMLISRLVEGLLISMVREMDNRSIQMIENIEKSVLLLFKEIYVACQRAPMYRPRYFLLYAHYHYIKGNIPKAYQYLGKATQVASQQGQATMTIWIEHTRNYWKGKLNPKLINYWCVHVEADNLLDYREFDTEKGQIVPYTLPLPKDIDK